MGECKSKTGIRSGNVGLKLECRTHSADKSDVKGYGNNGKSSLMR